MTLPEDIERCADLKIRMHPCSRTTKAARFKEAPTLATYDKDILARWHNDYPCSNWRIVFEGSGIVALDVDAAGESHEADGIAAMAALVAEHGDLPEWPGTRSGGGGYGILFADPGVPLVKKTGHPVPGIDPRSGLLSLNIPPSIHIKTRKPYRWIRAPWDVAPPPMPGWLLDLLRAPPPREYASPPVTSDRLAYRRLHLAVQAIADAGTGQGNHTLNKQAFLVGQHVGAGTIGEIEAERALYYAARSRGIPHSEACGTIRSGFKGGRRKPLERRVV